MRSFIASRIKSSIVQCSSSSSSMSRNSCNTSFFSTFSAAHQNLPKFSSPAEIYSDIRELTKEGGDYTVHNYMAVIDELGSPEECLVETELFPRESIEFYTAKNMGWEYTKEAEKQWLLPERGGEQGDYRDGMPEKIANAISCLSEHPHSKRAVIPIPFARQGSAEVDWRDQGQTKCCRELYLYIHESRLCTTAVLRMQNASIFPKNIHFFSTLIHHVANELGIPVGSYTHIIANLCHDRSATQC
eukprot:g1383.t1